MALKTTSGFSENICCAMKETYKFKQISRMHFYRRRFWRGWSLQCGWPSNLTWLLQKESLKMYGDDGLAVNAKCKKAGNRQNEKKLKLFV